MKCMHSMQDSSLLSGEYLVIHMHGSAKTRVIENLSAFATDVQELTVSDPCQLYEIDEYSFDVLIVSDSRMLSDCSREYYRILSNISPDALIIVEIQSQIDIHTLSKTGIQFESTISVDADAVDVQLAIMDALEKRELRLRKMNNCLENYIHTKIILGNTKSVQLRTTFPIWFEILLGLLYVAIGVILISIFVSVTS